MSLGVAALGVAAGLQAVSSIVGYNSTKKQNEAQSAVNTWNAHMGYDTALSNTQAANMIGRFNAMAATQAGRISAQAYMAGAEMNAEIIRATAAYNDSLLATEEEQLWDALELDVELMRNERLRERGTMLAIQSVSGTVMGTGSNADAVTDQMTQEALDLFVMRHNADIGAADILNARAQGLWEADMQAKKVMWEGQLAAITTQANANMGAASQLATTAISGAANLISAGNARDSQLASGSIQFAQNNMAAQSNLVTGLFGAAQTGVAAYYAGKTPTPTQTTDLSKTAIGTSGPAVYQSPAVKGFNTYFNNKYGASLTTPATSLIAGN